MQHLVNVTYTARPLGAHPEVTHRVAVTLPTPAHNPEIEAANLVAGRLKGTGEFVVTAARYVE